MYRDLLVAYMNSIQALYYLPSLGQQVSFSSDSLFNMYRDLLLAYMNSIQTLYYLPSPLV
jgi:hypothetical protein